MRRQLVAVAIAALVPAAPAFAAPADPLLTSGPCHEAVDEIMPLDRLAFFHRIVNKESRGREWATNRNRNGSRDAGCLQVNSVHGYDPDCLYEARCNIRAGLDLYRKYGTNPWRATR